MPSTDPLIVTLNAGPGTGKSTTAAMVFALLKLRGFNAELVPEYAKDLTWERRAHTLANAPYVYAKQMWRFDRLSDQVEVIVTDTSPLLSLVYSQENVLDEFKAFVLADYKRRRSLDIYLTRDPERPYNPKGRNQSREEAEALDKPIEDLLWNSGACDDIEYVQVQSDGKHANYIAALAESRL